MKNIKAIDSFCKQQKFTKTNTDSNFGSHMPYIFYSIENTKYMVFDILEGNVWKIYLLNFETNKISRIKTETYKNYSVNECNPTIYWNNEIKKYVLSYVSAPAYSGNRTGIIGYSSDLKNWEWKTFEQSVNFFADTLNWTIFSESLNGECISICNKQGELKHQILCTQYTLARITPMFNDDSKLFVSVYHKNPNIYKIFTILVDLNNLDQPEQVIMIDDSVPGNLKPYKGVIDPLTGMLYFTHRKSEEFEDREILCTTKYSVKPWGYRLLRIQYK
jgi:hypothetical protein